MIRYLETRVYVLAVSIAVVIHSTAIEVNVAINKKASQSGDLKWPENSTKFWKAGTAVNGHKSCNNVSSDYYSGTAYRQNPWWQVDLGRLYNISKVLVYGKQNPGHAKQYDDFALYATPDNDTHGSENRPTRIERSHPEYDHIQGPMIGRFITIMLHALTTGQAHPLVLCEVEVYSEAVNIASLATLTASKKLAYNNKDYKKENAVDGKDGDPDQCNCCYSSADMTSPYFTAVYSHPYEVYRIEIQGRTQGTENSALSHILVDLDDAPAIVNLSTASKSAYIIPNNSRVQNITISRNKPAGQWNGWFLMICELRIYAVDCVDGFNGTGCTHKCGHCAIKSSCNKTNGSCSAGCQPGYRNAKCDAECGHGTFGDNCTKQCHCYNDANCTNDLGMCLNNPPRCAPGWQGQSCNQECGHGTFGDNCTKQCHCYNDANCTNDLGMCLNNPPRCAPGWQGQSCNQECGHGTFGENCTKQCHCYNDANCTNDLGMCLNNPPRCAPGWQRQSCNQECGHGTFGDNCTQHCHCYKDVNCTSDQGICLDHKPRCAPGWQGQSCNQVCDYGKFGENCAGSCHCHDNANCTGDTGLCPDMCAPGWQGPSCDQECDHGTFGLNCSERCHCLHNANCTNDLGTCPDGQTQCAFGWQGQSCDKEALEQTEGSGVTVPAVIGIGVALVVFVVIGVAIFIKRRQHLAKGRSRTKYTSNNEVKLEESNLTPVNAEKPINNLPDGQQNNGFENETEEHAYYDFSPIKSEIKPCQLWFYIRDMQADECKSFYEEFESLPHGLKLPYTAAMIPENRPKHRYREMYAYDHSRVVLDITGPGQTDYINASHIQGFERTKKFIASQGPTDKMTNDFWRMVWQQNVGIIVMLTNVMENGNKKCEKYWPDDDKVDAYGEVKVRVIRTDMFVDHYTRQMEISMEGKPTRTVTQFHFRSWPDKDVPDSTWCLVNFWRAASRHPSGDAPIVVHCSAGIGRTGTYIALDYLYNQLQQEGSVRPFQAVHALRRQRVNLVQTREQYAYMHEAVADAIGLGTHFIWASQFQEYYDYMTHLQPGASKSPLKIQFELAVQSQRENKVAGESAETLADETYANADVAAEINAYRPQIKKRNSNNIKEMGAMYLPIYSGAEGFLIAKSPTEKSLVEFCSLVHEHNVKTVISLCDSTTKNYRACANLGVDTGALDGFFQVTALDATKFRSFDKRTYVLNEHGKEDGSRATLKVFDYKAWKAGYNTPAEAKSMLELLDAVTRWQPHVSEAQPILVHCNNGTRRSGLVCLVLSELQRLKREDGQINILDSLMQLKQRNMDVIENVGQYQYCFDVIRTYVQQSKEESVQVQKDQDQHIYTNM